jgi:hypothetical protein
MRIKIERSGGFAGINSFTEYKDDKFPSSLELTFRKLLDGGGPVTLKHTKPGGADYVIYKITLQDGNRNRTIMCSELEMNDSLKELVRYVENDSKKEKSF